MTDEKPNNIARDMAVRSTALDMAIRSNCGQGYDTNDHIVYDADDIISAAGKFEAFIKNGYTPTPTNLTKNLERTEKEGW